MPTPVNPTAVAGLVAQFKADSLSLSDTDPVASWAPAAGSETAAAAQGTSGQRPVYRTSRINGLPAVVFTAASSHNLDTGAWGTSHAVPNTAFAVAKITNQPANIFTGRAGVFNYIGQEGDQIRIGAGAASQIVVSRVPSSSYMLICAVYDGASSAIYLNSTTASATGTTGGGSSNMPGMRIGSTSAGTGNFPDGEIAEILFYDSALSQGDREGVLAWLDNKYALNLGIASISATATPTVASATGVVTNATTSAAGSSSTAGATGSALNAAGSATTSAAVASAAGPAYEAASSGTISASVASATGQANSGLTGTSYSVQPATASASASLGAVSVDVEQLAWSVFGHGLALAPTVSSPASTVLPEAALAWCTANGGVADTQGGEPGPTSDATAEAAEGGAFAAGPRLVVRVGPATAGASGRASPATAPVLSGRIRMHAGSPTAGVTRQAGAPVRIRTSV